MTIKVGDRVAAPVVVVFPERRAARSRYGYDIGTVVAVGKNKRTGTPAIKVRIPVADSVHCKKLTEEPFFEKWVFMADCDKV